MKVADLIRKLQAANPEATVVVTGYDHSYRSVDYAGTAKAEEHGRGDDREYSEFHNKGNMSDPGNAVVDVFLIN